MRKKYWAVKYGGHVRIAHEVTAEAAANYCYGMYTPRNMVCTELPKNPRYMSLKQKEKYF